MDRQSPHATGVLVSSRQVARLDTLAIATEATFSDGAAAGSRFIDVAMYKGLRFRVLPDRGLDIGSAWLGDVPIGWLSSVGDAPPMPPADRATDDDGMGWLSRFTGGLLTTCGPDNIGLPSTDEDTLYGLHGSWTDLRAEGVRIERFIEGDEIVVRVSGQLTLLAPDGSHYLISRILSTSTGTAVVEVIDEVRNAGARRAPIPMLYHVNFGAPLWGSTAYVEYPPDTRTIPRNDRAALALEDGAHAPEPIQDAEEYVFERVVPSTPTASVTVVNPSLGVRSCVAWDTDSLPTSHQWVHPAAGVYALGIEPANASLVGRSALRATSELPMLDSGASRRFRVRISASAEPPEQALIART